MSFTRLEDFIAHLKNAPMVPGTPSDGDWCQHVEEISVPAQVVLIREADWFYWLEVLPPRYQRGNIFCFAEGEEPFRLSWREAGSHFSRQLTAEETLLFCKLAGMTPPALAPDHLMGDEEQKLIEQHLPLPLGASCEGGGL
jgi:hypothetical protein